MADCVLRMKDNKEIVLNALLGAKMAFLNYSEANTTVENTPGVRFIGHRKVSDVTQQNAATHLEIQGRI